MTKRTTIADIAERAGVGVATVDRVLNGRRPVRPKTAERVLKAAEALDYHAHGLLRRRIEELAPAKTLGFILQKSGKWFYRTLAGDIRTASGDLRSIRASVDIDFVEALSPDDLVTAMRHMAERADAVAVVAVEHPAIGEEVARLKTIGIPVFALLSDLKAPDLAGYIGVDGCKAGRSAGWAITRLGRRDGDVGILIGSHRYLGHEEREAGFREYVREHAPTLRARESIVYLDDAAVAYEAMTELLKKAADLVGVYHCGGGTDGAVRALRESGRGTEIVYVCHETSPAAVSALRDGLADMIIASPTSEIAHVVAELMADSLVARSIEIRRRHVPFRLYISENIEPQP